jgi:mRNA interferase RelE/StbE
MKYEVIISKRAAKEIRSLPHQEIPKIFQKIKSLGDDPRPSGCKKLSGKDEELYRIRSGNYRVIYSIDDVIKIVDVRQVGDRKDVYQ